MKSKTLYLNKQAPLNLTPKCMSPQGVTPNRSPIRQMKCFSPSNLIKNYKFSQTSKKLKIIKKNKKVGEDSQFLHTPTNIMIRLKLEPKSPSRKSLNCRPESIKPLRINDDERSGVNSPITEKYVLRVDEDAIQRPYRNEGLLMNTTKEVSCSDKIIYWRKKRLEQYKIAKNIGSSKNTPTVSPKRVSKVREISELNKEIYEIGSKESLSKSSKVLPEIFLNLTKASERMTDISRRFSEEKCEGIQIFGKISAPVSMRGTPKNF